MVYNKDTFEVFHKLTSDGQKQYQKLLDEEAERIVFKNKHPIKYLMSFVREMLSSH